MNLEQFITYRLNYHDVSWYYDIEDEFKKHPLFMVEEEILDNASYRNEVLKYETEVNEEVVEKDSTGRRKVYHSLCIREATKSLQDYCWSTKTIDGYISDFDDLQATLDAIIKKISDVLFLALEIEKKLAIIDNARQKVIDHISRLDYGDTPSLYKKLWNQFVIRFRRKLNGQFADLSWIHHLPIQKVQTEKNLTPRPQKKPKKSLKNNVCFFTELINLADSNQSTIISDDEYNEGQKDAIVKQLLQPLYLNKTINTVVKVNFEWDVKIICYIFHKLSTEYVTKLNSQTLCSCTNITVKGKPLTISSFRANTSKFKNSDSLFDLSLKQEIDSLFHQYTLEARNK